MDDRDFIRELMNLFDRFFAEWLILNSEYEKSIAKDLEEMELEEGYKAKAKLNLKICEDFKFVEYLRRRKNDKKKN